MRIEMSGAIVTIVPEGENLDQLIRALARASFELAPSNLDDLSDWSEDDDLSEDELTACLHDGLSPLHPRLSMGIVRGRLCHTRVYQEKTGALTLDRSTFNEWRDPVTLRTVLERMQDYYLCISVGPLNHLFEGQMLDHRLACYNQARQTGESDWDFRRRIFSILGLYWPCGAFQFLLGSFVASWNEGERAMMQALAVQGRMIGDDEATLRDLLTRVAASYDEDPLPKRTQIKAAQAH